jgi:hypothetical protein
MLGIRGNHDQYSELALFVDLLHMVLIKYSEKKIFLNPKKFQKQILNSSCIFCRSVDVKLSVSPVLLFKSLCDLLSVSLTIIL